MNALQFLERTQAAYEAKQYAQALSLIADAEAEGKVCPDLLIIKGACVQLSSETDFPVDRALEVYRGLLASQPRNARAALEAGFFLLNVSDDPVRAAPHFSHAAKVFGDFFEQAVIGLSKSVIETGTKRNEAILEIEAKLSSMLDHIRSSQ